MRKETVEMNEAKSYSYYQLGFSLFTEAVWLIFNPNIIIIIVDCHVIMSRPVLSFNAPSSESRKFCKMPIIPF
jgi:hypothetical protein